MFRRKFSLRLGSSLRRGSIGLRRRVQAVEAECKSELGSTDVRWECRVERGNADIKGRF